MKRNYIIAGAVAIALASTAVIATAHDRGDGPRGMRGGPEMLFERFDVNGDGAITKDEIAAAAVNHFNEADSNGDGQLSAEEMAAMAQSNHAERMSERIARRIERHDTNGDGMLSLEEATAIAGGDRAERMFEHLDADGDGTITQAEAEAAKGKRGHGRYGKHGGDSN